MNDFFRASYLDDQRDPTKGRYNDHQDATDNDSHLRYLERTPEKEVRHKHYFLKPEHFYFREKESIEDSYRKPRERYHEQYHQAYYDDDPEASTSQQSYYDDDISELENSVLGHISNAAFSNHQFYDKRIPTDSYNRFREDANYKYQDKQPSQSYRTFDDDHNFIGYKGRSSNFKKPLRIPLHEITEDHQSPFYGEHYVPQRTRFPKSNLLVHNKKSISYDNLNHYIQRRPQQVHQYNDGNKDDNDSYYDRFRSYGARIPKREYFDEADYYDSVPYHRNHDRELNSYRKQRQTSVLDNIRENLPWPLSMVGRIGENDDTSRSDENTFPDSIQSILKVIDSQDDVGKEFDDHKVLPFLDVEEIK